MNNENLQSLRLEYSHLSSLEEKFWVMPYNVFPVMLTLAGALALYGSTSKGFSGIIVTYGVVLLVAWQSFIHSTINGIGLRLVELECKINNELKPESELGLNWFTKIIGEGNLRLKGLWLTNIVVFVLSLVFFCGASVLGWIDLRQRYQLPSSVCAVVAILPLILGITLLLSMWSVEKSTRREKMKIIQKYNVSPKVASAP